MGGNIHEAKKAFSLRVFDKMQVTKYLGSKVAHQQKLYIIKCWKGWFGKSAKNKKERGKICEKWKKKFVW